MLHSAFKDLRLWCEELGNIYNDRILTIEQNYQYLFDYYLSGDDAHRKSLLDNMAGEAFRLTDTMYADLLLKRGLVPEIQGFDKDNRESAIRYFSTCVHLQEEDYDYLLDLAEHPQSRTLTLMLMAALAQNLRNHFSESGILCLIRLMDSDSHFLRDQATANVILLLAQYDSRVSILRSIQEAFEAVVGEDEDRVFFDVLYALTKSTKVGLKTIIEDEDFVDRDLPDEIKELFGGASTLSQIVQSIPANEDEYLGALIAKLPDTWVFFRLVYEHIDEGIRDEQIADAYLEAGIMINSMWIEKTHAEEVLVDRIRSGHPTPQDYMNYGHLCFIQGDRLMAYENYREAFKILKDKNKLLALYRSAREKILTEIVCDRQSVNLMEDALVNL